MEIGNPLPRARTCSSFVFLALAAWLSFASGSTQAQTITTLAGSPPVSPATLQTRVGYLSHAAYDAAGALYFSDATNDRVLKKAAGSNTVVVVAGTGIKGFSGDGGLAVNAQLDYPSGLALDGIGNLYLADTGNRRIRKIALSTGLITTVAGSGAKGSTGDGASALLATMRRPTSIAFDTSGNLYISDTDAHRVRKLTVASGVISTVAGSGARGAGGDGGPATAAQLTNPAGIFLDNIGTLYIADALNHRVRRVSTGGIITTIAGTGVRGFSGDGGAATAAMLSYPASIVLDASGSLVISDAGNSRVRRITGSTIQTYAGTGVRGGSGDGGAAAAARLSYPASLVRDPSGNVAVVDSVNQRIRAIDRNTGIIQSVVGNHISQIAGQAPSPTQLMNPSGIAVDAAGNVFVADGGAHAILRIAAGTGTVTRFAGTGAPDFAGDGGQASAAAFANPGGLAFDAGGNLFVADTGNQRIRRIDAVTNVIATVAGDGVSGYFGDNGPATSASLSYPAAIAFGPNGDLFIADTNNHRVRRVSGGVIATVAGSGLKDHAGNGGPATQAGLPEPLSLAFDGAGNLYIGSRFNGSYRVVDLATGTINASQFGGGPASGMAMLDGMLIASGTRFAVVSGVRLDGSGSTVLAGNFQAGYSGDGGNPRSARLNAPTGVALDAQKNLYVADSGNRAVRKIVFAAPTAPTLNTATGGDGQISLAFTPGGDGGLPVIEYIATCGTVTKTGTASPLSVTGLTPGAMYSCSLAARGPLGTSPSSNTLSATVLGPPGEPRNVTATATNAQATVSFLPPDNNGGSPITSYTVTSNPGGLTVSGSASPLVVTGLTNGTAYTFTVRARNALGLGATSLPSNSVTPVTVPSAPTITSIVDDPGLAIVNFTPGNNGGSPVLDYTATCGAFSQTGTASPIVVAGLSTGQSYSCTVTTRTAVGSATSGAMSVTIRYAITMQLNVSTRDAAQGYTAVQFTVTLSGGPSPTGTITVRFGNGSSCTPTPAMGGGYACSHVYAAAGSYLPDASYAGNSTHRPAGVTLVGGPVVVGPGDTTPDAFSFPSQTGVNLNMTRVSSTIPLPGFNAPAPISVTNGAYQIGCIAGFQTAPGTILPGQSVCVRHTSASTSGTAVTTTLTVGGVSGTFTSTTTTDAPDTAPDPFSFAPRSAEPNQLVFNLSAVRPTGYNSPAPVTISTTSSYAAWRRDCITGDITGPGTLEPGQSICLVHRSSSVRGERVTTTITVGGVSADFVTVTGNPLTATTDLNGNGSSEILWRNNVTGELYAVSLNASFAVTGAALISTPTIALGPNWKVAAVGDADLNGSADIVLYNTTSGSAHTVLFNGALSPASGGGLSYTEPNLDWKIVGSGDFDGDGRNDLLYYNGTTGEVFLMLMNGVAPKSGHVIYYEPNLNWKIQKVADFNADLKADILWRNVATGDVFVQLMNGTQTIGGGVIYSEPNLAWQIQAAADFNADGKADILWRNTATGDVFMMLMNGAAVAGGSVFYSEPNPDWKIVATGDFNNDYRSDIVWRNMTTGQVFLMHMNGAAISSSRVVYTETNQDWQIVSP